MEDFFRFSGAEAVRGMQLGLVLVPGEFEGQHVGILLRTEKHWKVLHFEGRGKTKLQPALQEFAGATVIRTGLDPFREGFVVAMASRIHRRRERLPYGLRYVDALFNEHGVLVQGRETVGLTCATFVMAVFRSAGVELLDRHTWPARHEDWQWQGQVLARIRDFHAGQGQDVPTAREVRLAGERGSARFRPEEVAGAVLGPEFPVVWDEARARGKALARWTRLQFELDALERNVGEGA